MSIVFSGGWVVRAGGTHVAQWVFVRWLTTIILCISTAAAAQTSGSITLRGHVAQIASVQFYSGTSFGPGVNGTNAGARGSALSYTLDLGNVGIEAGRSNQIRGGEVKLLLRSNSAYVLTASVQARGFKAGPGEMSLSDIGFGIPQAEIEPSGHRARSDGTRVLDSARFGGDPLQAEVVSGAPRFAASLADLQGDVPLLTGERISYGGSLNSPNNGLIVATRYAVLPQYFKDNAGFEATVTYTISTP